MGKKEEFMKNIDFKNLRFDYIKADYRFISYYKDGSWDEGELSTDEYIRIHEGSTAIHYGQQCFEGLKAYRTEDDRILLFRPYENAKRMKDSCEALMMQSYPEEKFVEAVKKVVKANIDFVPSYGSGSSLYIRPYLIGIGANVGVKAAPEYLFSIFVTPVGPYFKNGFSTSKFITTEFDRAAPNGTGAVKVGGNYAASLKAGAEAKATKIYADCIYLDAKTHTNIEEAGAANFFGITKNNVFVTPVSPSILPSITRRSLVYLAEHNLGMKIEERDVPIDSIDEFVEAGACGTAAVIAPIGGIMHNGKETLFYDDGKTPGPVTTKLYNLLTGIQSGDIPGPDGWVIEI